MSKDTHTGEDPPVIEQQIAWVYTEDLARSARFYEGVLGLRVERDQGTARIYASVGGARIGVCRAFDDRAVEPRGSMLSIVTPDVDGWYHRLKAADVPTQGPPRTLERFGIYCFFAEDPDGYIVEFQRFL